MFVAYSQSYSQEHSFPHSICQTISRRNNRTMGRMHSDALFAISSLVPAHVEMMGFLSISNNPMTGCTIACPLTLQLP